VSGCSGWNAYQLFARRIARGEADITIGLAGAKLPGGAVELAEAEDLSVARALCAESGVESARAQAGARFLREPGKSRSRGLFPGRTLREAEWP
jgi:hypothetical protein